MKPVPTSVAAVLILAGAASPGSLEWSVHLDRSDVTVAPDGRFDLVRASGLELSGMPGSPLLPSLPLSFVLPPEAGEVCFEADFSNPVTVVLSRPVVPAWLPGTTGGEGSASCPPDPAVYLSREPFPAERTSDVRIGRLCGFTIASCTISPWEYRPLEGSLSYYTDIRISISWTGGGDIRTVTDAQAASAARRVALLVENDEDIHAFMPPVRPAAAGDAAWVAVCDSAYASDFEPLRAMWEGLLGSAAILTIQEIEGSCPGLDAADRLRNAIRDLWAEHGALYVLLAGDETLVPVRFVYTRCEDVLPESAPVDHYFGDLDGSWDANGDGVYGQSDDSLDLYMDVLVGRALIADHSHAATFVDRTMTYASSPPDGPWGRTALLCGAILFEDIGYIGGRGCDSLAAALPRTWDVVRVYEEPSLVDGSDTHIEYLQAGTGWNYYAGHGNRNGIWWHDKPYTMMSVTLAQELQNGFRAGIHTSIGCHPGDFCDDLQCCAEALLRNPDGGAVSVTFNTTYGWEGYWPELGPSERMCIDFTSGVFMDHLPSLGEAFASAKDRRIPWIHGEYDRNLQSILAWTAFHDPALAALGVEPMTPIPPIPLTMGAPRPNPSIGGAPLTFDVLFRGGTAELSAWDMAGRLLWRDTATAPGTYQWDGRLPDGRRAPAGVYIISARRGGLVVSRRAVILE